MKIYTYILALLLLFTISSCFSFKLDMRGGARIDPKIQTMSIQYFDTRAPRAKPTVSQDFTDQLIEYMERNTDLRLVNGMGDIDFDGYIANYTIQATGISSEERASKTRLTIGIKVKYTNNINPDDEYDQTFTAYREIESNEDMSSREDELIEEIIEEIIEQVFNQAFVNW